jgi:hypothetical protein
VIAALYVETGGPYFGLPDVDPWDVTRDARLYDGPHPVVAHPPCARWCRLAGLVEHRYGHKKKGDGGCFAAALEAVERWGGVLEHPAYSDAWAAFDLPRPTRGSWTRGLLRPGWSTELSQAAYGHRAREMTWLYYVGGPPPPSIDWSTPNSTAWVSWADRDRYRDNVRMGRSEAKATPLPFRDLLLQMARSVNTLLEPPMT